MIDFQDTSFLKIENDVSLFLHKNESDSPSFLNPSIELFYFRYLHVSLLQSASEAPLSENEILAILIFLRYLFRSNLCFDVAFMGSIQLKQSKLGLMYGDYYLARAGKTFQDIPGYHLLGDLLVKTLKRISLSQWHQPANLTDYSQFSKMNSLRYGSLFELSFTIPFFLNQHKPDLETKLRQKANALAMYCTLMKNSFLFSFVLPKRNILLLKLRKYIKE